MKRHLLPVILFLSFVALIGGSGCSKKSTTDTSIPTLSTQDVILDVTSTTAQSGGTISSIGGSSLTANGVCYSTSNHTPTISDTKTSDPLIQTSYTYTSNLTGLTPNTTYYLRAYATNQFGTGYGSVITFTTSATLASVTGVVTTFAGSGTGGYLDGNGTGAEFNTPQGMAVDAFGNIYISDTFNNRIRKIAGDGTVTTIAGNGTAGYVDGDGADAEFYAPVGLTVDGQGNIYVADFGNNVIRKITPSGSVSTYAGNGYAAYVDGAALNVAAFSGPSGVALNATTGDLYVADRNNNMIRKVTAAGVVSRVAGVTSPGYTNTTVNATNGVYGAFKKPSGIVLDANGNIYVADLGNSAIRQINPAGVITTVAGGPGQSTLVGDPVALAIDATGNIMISDESGRVIELTSAKVLYVLSGAPNVAGYADGSGADAQFSSPQGITVDGAGNIYVADMNNNRIRKVVITSINN